MAAKDQIDYEAEGLLDEVEGEDARRIRTRLLDYLVNEEHIGLEELKIATEQQRLFLLPVERALGGTPDLRAVDVAEQAGVDLELFVELRKSLGLTTPDIEAQAYSEWDVKTMQAVKLTMELGISEESVREINRVLGAALSQLAATVERQFLATFIDPKADEAEMAARYAAITRATTPQFAIVLQHLFNLHLRDQLRADIFGGEGVIDYLSDKRELTVCFADLVGFTSLGEQIPAEELGAIAERLNTIAGQVVRPPVRLVKTIGDAVLLVSTSPLELIETALELVAEVDKEDEGFPEISIGLDVGQVVERGGDVYGPPVNMASRLSDSARPGSVLVTGALQHGRAGLYDFTSVGRRKFKGVANPVAVYRVRPKGERERIKRERRERAT